MSRRTVAIELKIPDNTAFTALSALQRLGVAVERVERGEVWEVDDRGNPATLVERVAANPAIFNPNKHRIELRDDREGPQAGEAWITPADDGDMVGERLGGSGIADVARAARWTAWRLRDASGAPVDRATLAGAVDRLLCNPAVEKVRYGE